MITVFAVNLFVIGVTEMIHYEFMYRFTLIMPQLKIRHLFRIVRRAGDTCRVTSMAA